MHGAVRERRGRPTQLQHLHHRIMRDAAKGYDGAQAWHGFDGLHTGEETGRQLLISAGSGLFAGTFARTAPRCRFGNRQRQHAAVRPAAP